jgi:PhzF family phenazine biosynthesis protein
MGYKLVIVDAFTSRPFGGNPAAVCFLPQAREEDWMQNVAQELNLPATSFLSPEKDGFRLRWFTPRTELELCGHGTFAGAHFLRLEEYLKKDSEVRFYTRSGLLTARLAGDWIEVDFPSEREKPSPQPSDLIRALGVPASYVGKNRLDYLVEVDSEETVRKITPDFELLKAVPTRGVMVTSLSQSGDYDFVSRFFAPSIGIDEDQVTGSAHCCLGPYWSAKLQKDQLTAFQASRRGGVIRVRITDDNVRLGGQVTTVLRGEFN